MARKHNHYFRPYPYKEIDVYRILLMYGVTDPCLQHALKKLLVAGGRGAGKDIKQDIREVIDSCVRFLEMRDEEDAVAAFASITPPNETPSTLAAGTARPHTGSFASARYPSIDEKPACCAEHEGVTMTRVGIPITDAPLISLDAIMADNERL